MEVYIDEEVHKKLISFYQAALRHHEALDEATVDFHFAYQVYDLEDEERIVRVHDVVHSMSYH